MDSIANDPKGKKAAAQTPVDEALKRVADPVFNRHPSGSQAGSTEPVQAGGQPGAQPGASGSEAVPLDAAATALARQKVSQALNGALRVVDRIFDNRLHKIAKKFSGGAFADELIAETGMTDEERDSFSDLAAQIAEEEGWTFRHWKKFLAGSILAGVLWRKGEAVQELVRIAREQKAKVATIKGPV